MGKEKLKIKYAPKKINLISNNSNDKNKNELSLNNNVKIKKKFLHKKRKVKKNFFIDEIGQGKNKYYNNIKSNYKNNKIKKNSNEEEKDLIDDKIVCTHLLLNSYANTNTQDFLPEKTIQQRINTMREKITSIFPDLID